jgi:drug/metabolite transporter (DMT)-like permease
MNKRALFKYIAALLLFGSNGIIASMITMGSHEIVMFRTLIGCIVLFTLYLAKYRHFTFWSHKKSFVFLVFSGISMGVSWLFLYEAYDQLGVSLASLGYYCGPVIVMALSPIVFNEKLTIQKTVGFFIVLAGIALVNGIGTQDELSNSGIICALMSALMYACMVIFNKKARDIVAMENAVLQLTLAFFTVFILLIATQRSGFDFEVNDIIPLMILGVCNTGFGCYLYFSSIDNLHIQTVAILGYLEPLSAVLFSFIFLNEALSPLQIAGAFCIIGGAITTENSIKTFASKTGIKQ